MFLQVRLINENATTIMTQRWRLFNFVLTGPDQTMTVAASLALAGSCSELAGPRVPDVVVTHSEGCLLTHSETKAQCEGLLFWPLNLRENMASFNFFLVHGS